MKTHKLTTLQSALVGVAGNAPAYGVAIATSMLISGSLSFAPLAVLICGLAMIGILVAYQKLNAFSPDCGAAYAWVGKIIHPVAGFLAGWSLLSALEFFMVSAILAAGQSAVRLMGLDSESHKLMTYSLSIGTLVLITVPALLGAKVFGKVQSLLTLIELVIIAVLAIASFVNCVEQITIYLTNPSLLSNAFEIRNLSKGIVIAVFFFWGWDVIFNLSEETHDTANNSSTASIITIVILIIIYSMFTLIAASVLSEQDVDKYDQNILFAIANKVLPYPWSEVAVLAFFISVVGSLNASLIQFSRTLLSKSRNGIFPKSFSLVSSQSGVPYFGVLTTALLAITLSTASYFSGTINEVITAGVNGSAIFVAYYYGLTGIACACFFLRSRVSSLVDFVKYIVAPILSSAMLVICATYSSISFSPLTTGIVSIAFIIGFILAQFQPRSNF